MTVQMLIMNTAEALRATGNAMVQVNTVPKTSLAYQHSYFTANVSGAVSGNLQCSPSGFTGGIKANTSANTPPTVLPTALLGFHCRQTDFYSGVTIQSRGFYVSLYAGNTAIVNSGATVYPPNTTLQRVITIADQGSDAGGNTWGGYKEWDVADATITLTNNQSVGYANTVTYSWAFPGGATSNTERPWQWTGAGGATTYPITIIYQY